MKRQWSAWLIIACMGSVAAPVSLQAQEKTKRSKIVIIEDEDQAAESTSPSDDQKKESKQKQERRAHMAVVTASGDDKEKTLATIEKQLENSGVDAATRKSVMEKLQAHFKEQSTSNKPHSVEVQVNAVEGDQGQSTVDVQLNGEAIVVGKDGKEQRVRLNGFKQDNWPLLLYDKGADRYAVQWNSQFGGPGNAGPGSAMQWRFQSEEMNPAQKEKLAALLKKAGVADDQIESILKEMSANHRQDMRFENQERFVIGVALERANSDEMEDEDEDDSDDEEPMKGLSVIEVFEGSPADKAGIEAGDVLLSADGAELESMEQLIAMIQEAGNNKRGLKVQVAHGDKARELTITPRKEVVEAQMNTLPSSLQEALSKVRQNIDGGFVMPPNNWMGGAMGDISGIKEELESLKKEMKELRSQLKSLKKD